MRKLSQQAVDQRPRRPRAPGAAPARHSWLLQLQTSAGNRAVAGLVIPGRAALLRAPNPRDKPGWEGADPRGKGWNVKERTVGEIWRVPVQDLTIGSQQAFAEGVVVEGEPESTEGEKTRESAARRAIVLIPKGIDPDGEVDVLLHFHGWGFRPGDPYAGWRQRKSDQTVRDVDLDRIEAQMEEAGKEQLKATGSTQMIGILPQGIGASSFGSLVSPEPYIKEVLEKVVAVSRGTQIPVPKEPKNAFSVRRFVLSAHSGGGEDVKGMLGSGGGKLAEIVLFDAIHGTEKKGGLKAVIDWATGHLERVRRVLANPNSAKKERADAVAACPILRAYASKPSRDKESGYSARYRILKARIDEWFQTHGAELGTEQAAVKDRFKVEILEGAGHETIVRGLGDDPAAGPLADALRSLDKPGAPSSLRTGTTSRTGAPSPVSRATETADESVSLSI